MGSGRSNMESLRRATRTVLFMVIMVGSLLASSAALIVAMADVIVPCVLLSTFTCCSTCYSLKFDWNTYSFRSSLADIPLLSALRSVTIICAYYICDVHGLSNGPYMGTTVICALASAVILTVKVCLLTISDALRTSAPSGARSPRLKQSWGMPAMFLSSMVLALGHIVVAYRTRCQARRRLLFHGIDPEAVLACKAAIHGYQKISRSPTSSPGKITKVDSEGKMHSIYEERDLPAKVLADDDSLFILCEGVVIHYKIIYGRSFFGSLTHTTFQEDHIGNQCVTPGRLRFDNPHKSLSLSRSFSHCVTNMSLHTPLMGGSPVEATVASNSALNGRMCFSQQVPGLKLEEHKHDEFSSPVTMPQPGRVGLKTGQQQMRLDGIIMIHGFGGGVFSWRHVMNPLARHTGCAVAAFDRPGWGLTARPRRSEWEEKRLPNPYELQSQVNFLFSFCQKLGFSSVVLVGHDDGGLLALMAAEKSHTCTGAQQVSVKGVVLIGVSISREVVPTFARVLLHTSLGRHMLRPLLRTEIIQVANRRAWHDASKLTPDVLDLYKAPLHVEGWDNALAEVSRLSIGSMFSSNNASELLKAVQGLPVLIAAGAEDILVSLRSSQALASRFSNSVSKFIPSTLLVWFKLESVTDENDMRHSGCKIDMILVMLQRLVAISGCGHLPHEECPKALLAAIIPFVSKLFTDLSSEDSLPI